MYSSQLSKIPLILNALSLISVTIVSLYQLQTIIKASKVAQADRWSTVIWSSVHIVLCVLFLCENLQFLNILVVLCLAGVLLSIMICIVAICSCYVIISNSRDWAPHVHLTCLCFWVVVQYMSVRLPMDDISYVTTVPVIAMASLRVLEHYEDGIDRLSVVEWTLWIMCTWFHICLDVGWWKPATFYWLMFGVLAIMLSISGHWRDVCVLAGLPFILFGMWCYTMYRYIQGYQYIDIQSEITKMYEELTAAPPLEPFEICLEEEDFDTTL